jgi:hypothetical protein
MKNVPMALCFVCVWFAMHGVPALGADSPSQPPALRADGTKPLPVQTNDGEPQYKRSVKEMMARARAEAKDGNPSSDIDVLVEQALKNCYVNKDIECNAAIDLHDRKWKEEFTQKSFAWHLFSSKLIFYLVIAIVIFGLYVTYVQFNRDYRDWSLIPHHSNSPVSPAPGALPEGQAVAGEVMLPRPVSSLKLSAGGLELSSQVIGLIVLALSFGFFYLYVKEIHPMVERHGDLVPPMYSPTAK